MVSCQQYDYVEIACMHKYPIILTLKNGKNFEGIAYDTKVNDKREECIILKTADAEKIIVLDEIAKMEVQVKNPHFSFVQFK